jgi:hypothetical protein
VTSGVVTPVVLLPSCSAAWPAERRAAALLHEFAHVERWDCATQLVARLACAVYWFNPLIWVAARALRDEREHAADDRVLGAGIRASDYAGLLLDVARTAGPPLPPPAASFADARRSPLERRVRSILDPRRPRRSAGRAVAAAAVLAATCAVAPLATANPPAAPPREPDRASAPPGAAAARGGPDDPGGAPAPQEPATPERRGRPAVPAPRPTPAPIPSTGREVGEGEIAVEPGSQQAAVVAALEEALEDEDEGVREQARWALRLIRIQSGGRSAPAAPRVRVDARPRPVVEEPAEAPAPHP